MGIESTEKRVKNIKICQKNENFFWFKNVISEE